MREEDGFFGVSMEEADLAELEEENELRNAIMFAVEVSGSPDPGVAAFMFVNCVACEMKRMSVRSLDAYKAAMRAALPTWDYQFSDFFLEEDRP